MNLPSAIPVIGFVAYSGTGKTTLLTQLIPRLLSRGILSAVIKHAHHNFEIDIPGKDSYRLRQAGAAPMLVASANRWAMMMENPASEEPQLDACIARIMTCTQPDIILVEGFKHEHFAKVELHRPKLGHPLLCVEDDSIIAVATDQCNIIPQGITALDINNFDEIADFVETFLHTTKRGNSVLSPS